jgi:hypothetical protein
MSNDQIESAAREIYEFRWGLSLEAIAAILHKHLGRGEGERDRLTQKELERLEAALLRELSALRQRVGELETMLADWGVVMGKEVGYPSAESMDRLRWAKEKVVLEARKLAAARQAGEGRTK